MRNDSHHMYYWDRLAGRGTSDRCPMGRLKPQNSVKSMERKLGLPNHTFPALALPPSPVPRLPAPDPTMAFDAFGNLIAQSGTMVFAYGFAKRMDPLSGWRRVALERRLRKTRRESIPGGSVTEEQRRRSRCSGATQRAHRSTALTSHPGHSPTSRIDGRRRLPSKRSHPVRASHPDKGCVRPGYFRDHDTAAAAGATGTTSAHYYLGYRFYNSRTGRFINRDPIEERGGLNLYAHVHGDVINRWDRLGLRSTNHNRLRSGPASATTADTLEDPGGRATGEKFKQEALERAAQQMQEARQRQAGDTLPSSQGPPRGSPLGDSLRRVPLLGFALGTIGDTLSGVGNLVTGRIGRGLGEIGAGVTYLAQVVAVDAFAAVLGVAAKGHLLADGAYNVVAGAVTLDPSRSFRGISQIGGQVIPTYGFYAGAYWGSRQFEGKAQPIPLNRFDWAAFWHDLSLDRGSEYTGGHHSAGQSDRQWIRDTINHPGLHTGPIGTAYQLLGIPFFYGASQFRNDRPLPTP
ncbi:MAG: RHS repeat-associated core domain-containing protein [Puniceicoccaceae bacterium]|nr:MAG: RHS repeat-associated core domain-containing protein [Puniceicoccaceae bacterium]